MQIGRRNGRERSKTIVAQTIVEIRMCWLSMVRLKPVRSDSLAVVMDDWEEVARATTLVTSR